jgi:hypothetical protein
MKKMFYLHEYHYGSLFAVIPFESIEDAITALQGELGRASYYDGEILDERGTNVTPCWVYPDHTWSFHEYGHPETSPK